MAWLRAVACVAVLAACGPPSPPNVLLVTVDTLRADHLGTYGYRLDTSPNLDRLAARGVLFTDCTVQRPKTTPSMASFMTGAHPKTIGARQGYELPDSLLLMAELHRDAGFATGAVVASISVGRSLGFDQGFDRFLEAWAQPEGYPLLRAGRSVKEYNSATVVTDVALRLLRELGDERPFFVWLHYFDPHGPYLPPASHADLFSADHPAEPVPLDRIPSYQQQPDADGRPIADLAYYKARYDAEIRYFDDELGRLLAAVEALPLTRGLRIALTADHGESLGEHDYYLEHGRFSYQANARVPCVLAGSGIEEGRRVDTPIGLIDLSATLVGLSGIGLPVTFEGRNVVGSDAAAGDAAAPAHVFMESGESDPSQLAVREGRWKLIHVRADADRRRMAGTELELYDVIDDPHETRNRVAEEPALAARLRDALAQWYARGPAGAGRALDPAAMDPREVEMLRELGYLE